MTLRAEHSSVIGREALFISTVRLLRRRQRSSLRQRATCSPTEESQPILGYGRTMSRRVKRFAATVRPSPTAADWGVAAGFALGWLVSLYTTVEWVATGPEVP